jgi:hypothetical protein
MESNEWEDQLRDLLGEYNTWDTQSPLGTNANTLNTNSQATNPSPNDQNQAWKRIEATLDAADQAFDETVRQRVNQFHVSYNPHSWPKLLQRLADTRYLRTKLIVLKSVEMAILLLLILSAVNIERSGKLPFNSSTPDPLKQEQSIPSGIDQNTNRLNGDPEKTQQQKPNNDFTSSDQLPNTFHGDALAVNDQRQVQKNSSPAHSTELATDVHSVMADASKSIVNDESLTSEYAWSTDRPHPSFLTNEIPASSMKGLPHGERPQTVPVIMVDQEAYITEPIASAELLVDYGGLAAVPEPKFVHPVSRTYAEFGIVAQVDYNALKMPEDRLYSSGREIIFPSKGIMSPGYGAGFTIAIGHPIWALETGIIYNAKDFEPGRQLIVGGAFDNGSVEFEAMKLQLVSLPVQYRYRFDHTGRFKAYGMVGGGFHVIAQSNIDVRIQYHFASLSFGENPNNDPNLAQTIQESRRIREHIRDGAPFSTKSFLSANAGLGMEYMLSEHKTIFLQSVVQYQIPNIAFSNNNGKHLRSVSLQAGIRSPLGK